MRWIKRPGFHQIEGDPQCGKTTYAILQAVGRENVAWVNTPLDDPFGLFHTLDWKPDLVIDALRIGDAFRTMEVLQERFDFIILDSLAGLMPDHPQGYNIAEDVERAWFQPEVPILIINQRRYPTGPGGSLWRGALESTARMMRICEHPLVTWIFRPFETLIWAPGGGPIIKPTNEMDLMVNVDLIAEKSGYPKCAFAGRGVFAQKRQGVTW